ncbi:MAG TPA: hotdog domain-containing protein [Cyclobacteriaceae bacterium]|nr:hotdog domain-containing protein [Cyclobacteriaceae bacterium]
MKNLPNTGDIRVYRKKIVEADVAAFHGEVLHAVYSTFAMARDMEWSSRLFFIEMKEEDEEGVGTHLSIDHLTPAFVGEELVISAKVISLTGNELICSIEAKVGERIVAKGKTGQRMLKRDKLKKLFMKTN